MYIKKQPELVSSEIKESIVEEAKMKKIIKEQKRFLENKTTIDKKIILIQ